MDQEKLAKLIAQEKAFEEKFGDPSSDDVKSTKKSDDDFDFAKSLIFKILIIITICLPIFDIIMHISYFQSIK